MLYNTRRSAALAAAQSTSTTCNTSTAAVGGSGAANADHDVPGPRRTLGKPAQRTGLLHHHGSHLGAKLSSSLEDGGATGGTTLTAPMKGASLASRPRNALNDVSNAMPSATIGTANVPGRGIALATTKTMGVPSTRLVHPTLTTKVIPINAVSTAADASIEEQWRNERAVLASLIESVHTKTKLTTSTHIPTNQLSMGANSTSSVAINTNSNSTTSTATNTCATIVTITNTNSTTANNLLQQQQQPSNPIVAERSLVTQVLQRSAQKPKQNIGKEAMPGKVRAFGADATNLSANGNAHGSAPKRPTGPAAAPRSNKNNEAEQEVEEESIDLDAEDLHDPLMVAEYVKDIVLYMWELERSTLPSASYMDQQKEINWSMRAILVDWLIEVQWKLRLLPETLFLSIHLIDRFLSKRAVSLVKLQLVGLTATLIASKVEEVLAPSVGNFIYLADNAYDQTELLKAERYMLSVMNFSLAYANPMTFLRRISKAENYDPRTRTLAKYFMELSLVHAAFVGTPGSLTAAGSVFLARRILGVAPPWNAILATFSNYGEAAVQAWAAKMLDVLQTQQQPGSLETTWKKYGSRKLLRASLFVDDWIRRTYPTCPTALNPRPPPKADGPTTSSHYNNNNATDKTTTTASQASDS